MRLPDLAMKKISMYIGICMMIRVQGSVGHLTSGVLCVRVNMRLHRSITTSNAWRAILIAPPPPPPDIQKEESKPSFCAFYPKIIPTNR